MKGCIPEANLEGQGGKQHCLREGTLKKVR